MGRKNLPANAALKTAEMPSLGKLWPVWGVLVACVWIAFSPVLSNGFVDWDDHDWILDNHSFRGLGWEQIRFAFTTFNGGVYQPLGWLVQSLTYEFFGLDPRGYHLVSLLFHVVNVVLLHLLCVRLLARRMPEVAERLGGCAGLALRRSGGFCTPSIPSGLSRSPGRRARPTCPASPSRYSRRWPICEPTLRAGFSAVPG